MTIDERLEAITQSVELLASMQIHAEQHHDSDMAELREGQVKLQEGQVKLQEGHAKLQEGHVKLQESQAKTEHTLRRAIRLAVQDARRQRNRNQEFQETMRQIATMQRENEQLLKAFLERGGNGKH